MKGLVRAFLLAIVVVVVTAGVLGGGKQAAAANGYEQWVTMDDGYTYYWDGYSYTQLAAPRADGGIDVYLAVDGQWDYAYSAGSLTDGSFWMIYQGVTYVQSSTATTQIPTYSDAGTIGGGGYCERTGACGYTTIGGGSFSSTGYPEIDALTARSNQNLIDIALRPNCIGYLSDSNTCYYE